MALKGTIYGTTSNQYITAKIEWSAVQSTSNNTSTITATLYYCKSSTSTAATYGTLSGRIYIGGSYSAYSKSVTLNANNTYVKIASYTLKVDHNNDGTKNIAIYATGAISGTTLSSTTFTEKDRTVTLNTIPRAAILDSLSCSSSYFTGNITYKYTSTTTTYYVRGNLSLNINGKYIAIKSDNNGKPSSTSQQTKTITLDNEQLQTIYSNLPSATKGILRLTLRTYSDSSYQNQVGSADYKEITLSIPATVKPKVGAISLTPSTITLVNTETGAATNSTINLLVQGKNKLTIVASGTQPGSGSKIASYTFKAYNESGTLFYEKKVTSTSASQSLALSPISYAGTLKFQVYATDSRGRTSAATEKTIISYAYNKPSLTSFNITRSITNGVNYLNCTYTPKYSSVNSKNTITVTLHYNDVSAHGSGEKISVNVGSNSAATYKAYLSIRDSLGGYAVTTTQTVYGETRAINVSAGGTGIAFGKMAEKNQFVESRWTFAAPRGRFTATTDLSGTSQNDVALRIGDEKGKHIDVDGNEIQAKSSPTAVGTLNINPDGGATIFGGTTIVKNDKSYRSYASDGSTDLNLIKLTGSNNITIGAAGTGTRTGDIYFYSNSDNTDLETLKLGKDSTSRYMQSVPTYQRTYSNAPNMYITSLGTLGRSTSSSKRYKTNIKNVENAELDPYKILDIPVRQYKYNLDNIPVDKNPNDIYIGLIAEEVNEIYPIATEYSEDGQVEMWNIKALFPALLKIVQDQQKEIDALKAEISNIKNKN